MIIQVNEVIDKAMDTIKTLIKQLEECKVCNSELEKRNAELEEELRKERLRRDKILGDLFDTEVALGMKNDEFEALINKEFPDLRAECIKRARIHGLEQYLNSFINGG